MELSTWVAFWELWSPTLVLKSSLINLQIEWFGTHVLNIFHLFGILLSTPPILSMLNTWHCARPRNTRQKLFLSFSFFSPSLFRTGLAALGCKHTGVKIMRYSDYQGRISQCSLILAVTRILHLTFPTVAYSLDQLKSYQRPGHCFLETTGVPDNGNPCLILGS